MNREVFDFQKQRQRLRATAFQTMSKHVFKHKWFYGGYSGVVLYTYLFIRREMRDLDLDLIEIKKFEDDSVDD